MSLLLEVICICCLLSIILLSVTSSANYTPKIQIFVSPAGKDTNPGTLKSPVVSLDKAQKLARTYITKGQSVQVNLRAGTYYLTHPLVFTKQDSSSIDHPVLWTSYKNEKVAISGGQLIKPSWEPYRDGILMARIGKLDFDQFFLNGDLQHMARYPDFDPNARNYNGTAADCIAPERVKRWSNPAGGFVHALHANEWGDFHYIIKGVKPDGTLDLEGGWQNNRLMGMHDSIRFVENVFEELNAPGEWYMDHSQGILYFYPPKDIDLATAEFEVAGIRHLIEFRGTAANPVKGIRISNITLTHTSRTFMDNKEPLLRSDWTTYRGGAVFATGTEDCSIEDCTIDQVGGNAVFINNYNRHFTVRGCRISRAGANCIAFIGNPKTVRSPLFEYNQRQSFESIDKQPGPNGTDYPSDCLFEDCLIYQPGRIEKQTVGVQISMSEGITISHCSIYDCPRAGINISEGTFGGHEIKYCDIFDTVKETGDHGSFNSWGRDRWWELTDIDFNKLKELNLSYLPKLDMVKSVLIHDNRWRCDHGWDIDLDDGSTWYHIYNNLCLHGGIKNREGFYRTVENNIIVDNSLHPHVWYTDSGDIFRSNIVFTTYAPIRVPEPWGEQIDNNLLHTPGKATPEPATVLQEQSGRDTHSIAADAMFIDASRGDYRVKSDSPALNLGFKNFPMNQFGVIKPSLKKIAKTPELPSIISTKSETKSENKTQWLGATIKNVVGLGDRSAYGLPDETGVVVMEVPNGCDAGKLGLRHTDVVVVINGKKVDDVEDILSLSKNEKLSKITIYRGQKKLNLWTK